MQRMLCRRVLNDARKVHVLVPLCSGYFVCCQLDSIGTMKNICCCCCCLLLCFINNCTQPVGRASLNAPLATASGWEKEEGENETESERADELRQRTRHFHQFPFVLVKCLKIPTNTCCSGAPASPLPSTLQLTTVASNTSPHSGVNRRHHSQGGKPSQAKSKSTAQ